MAFEKLPEIPKEFYNSETGAPFTNCLMCNCQLQDEQRPYTIERAIRHYPEMELNSVVFEYALCAGCMAELEKELSDSTKAAIAKYFGENFNYHLRPKWQPSEDEDIEPFDISEWTNTCSVKGLPKGELYEYTLCARCIGNRIIPDVAPYMVSGQAQDELIELFSNESLGFMNGFTDKYFSGPPELRELFRGRPILV
ncbi:MAG: hypothetical protein EP314_04360 [Bacteroidetes bacterium]|nr:MAG: hypothetical protein EP314_04360 [Bacteroidota bacterium]